MKKLIISSSILLVLMITFGNARIFRSHANWKAETTGYSTEFGRYLTEGCYNDVWEEHTGGWLNDWFGLGPESKSILQCYEPGTCVCEWSGAGPTPTGKLVAFPNTEYEYEFTCADLVEIAERDMAEHDFKTEPECSGYETKHIEYMGKKIYRIIEWKATERICEYTLNVFTDEDM